MYKLLISQICVSSEMGIPLLQLPVRLMNVPVALCYILKAVCQARQAIFCSLSAPLARVILGILQKTF